MQRKPKSRMRVDLLRIVTTVDTSSDRSPASLSRYDWITDHKVARKSNWIVASWRLFFGLLTLSSNRIRICPVASSNSDRRILSVDTERVQSGNLVRSGANPNNFKVVTPSVPPSQRSRRSSCLCISHRNQLRQLSSEQR